MTRLTEEASILEEMRDLRALLDGLPEGMRHGPFAQVYERRLERLQRDLVVLAEAER
jgi:hypothetical protein